MPHDFNQPPASYGVPSEWSFEEGSDSLAAQVWLQVLRGNADVDSYLETFVDDLDEAGVSEEAARAWFASVIAMRRAQQDAWEAPPRSRLTEAFDELANIGVVARQDFSCCGNCASAEIWDERDASRTWRGYVYFHQQDTDSIIEDRATYLGYGVFPDSLYTEKEWEALPSTERETRYERHVRELMAEVREIFERHQIEMAWTGDLGRRIHLSNVDFFAPMPANEEGPEPRTVTASSAAVESKPSWLGRIASRFGRRSGR